MRFGKPARCPRPLPAGCEGTSEANRSLILHHQEVGANTNVTDHVLNDTHVDVSFPHDIRRQMHSRQCSPGLEPEDSGLGQGKSTTVGRPLANLVRTAHDTEAWRTTPDLCPVQPCVIAQQSA